MVDAISSSSNNPYDPGLDDQEDDARRRATAAATTRPATPVELPELPDVHGALLARATQAAVAQAAVAQASRGPLLALGVDASALQAGSDAPVQKRLDAFMASASPTYHVPKEGDVRVAAPFRMQQSTQLPPGVTDATSQRYVETEKRVKANDADLQEIARQHGITNLAAIKVGRGTPQQLQVLAQGLIDRGKLPPPDGTTTLHDRVRTMMCNYGLGLDCAGYVQQAALAANGITRAQAGFGSMLNEDLSHPSPAKFARVSPGEARAGDVIALGPPPYERSGHRLIVYDRHDASPEELAKYCGSGEGTAIAKGRVSVLQVDSSFGSGGLPTRGGVGRQTWLYDAASNQWGQVLDGSSGPKVHITGLPYDGQHPLLGIYRYSERH